MTKLIKQIKQSNPTQELFARVVAMTKEINGMYSEKIENAPDGTSIDEPEYMAMYAMSQAADQLLQKAKRYMFVHGKEKLFSEKPNYLPKVGKFSPKFSGSIFNIAYYALADGTQCKPDHPYVTLIAAESGEVFMLNMVQILR